MWRTHSCLQRRDLSRRSPEGLILSRLSSSRALGAGAHNSLPETGNVIAAGASHSAYGAVMRRNRRPNGTHPLEYVRGYSFNSQPGRNTGFTYRFASGLLVKRRFFASYSSLPGTRNAIAAGASHSA
jgi:hypothetical protein